MAEITSPDPKVRHIFDYEFRGPFGNLLMGATVCLDDGDTIIEDDKKIVIRRMGKKATATSLGSPDEEYILYRPHVAAVRILEYDLPEPTVAQRAEIKKLIEEQYSKRLDLSS